MIDLRDKDLDKLFQLRSLMEPVWKFRRGAVLQLKLHNYKVLLRVRCCVFTGISDPKGFMWEDLKGLYNYHNVGTVFKYEGKTLKVIPETACDCSACFFYSTMDGCTTKKTCSGVNRKDFIDIQFVEVICDNT